MFKYPSDIALLMSRVYWGSKDAQKELEELTKGAPELVLNVVESRKGASTVSYELFVIGDKRIATVELGTASKDTDLESAVVEHRGAFHRRNTLSRILNTSQESYQREGEKVLAALGTGAFHSEYGKHISPSKELTVVRSILQCADTIGVHKIRVIGITETNPDKLRKAIAYLANEPENQKEDILKGVYEA